MSKQINTHLKSLQEVQEGMINKIMCKKARVGIKLNRRDFLDPAKESLKNCSQYKKSNPNKYQGCRKYFQKVIDTTQRAIDRGKIGVKKYCGTEVSENKSIDLVENFLQSLYTDNRPQAKEWQGANIPVGDEDNRPNLIRECFTLESKRRKINCLRKLRDQVAMNPFYQARLDRFVDAITQTYEPTDEPGTIPGNEFKRGHVGEDLKESQIHELSIIDKQKCKSSKKSLVRWEKMLATFKKAYDQCKQKGTKDCTPIMKSITIITRKRDEASKKISGYCK